MSGRSRRALGEKGLRDRAENTRARHAAGGLVRLTGVAG